MFFKDFVSVKRQKIKRGASQTYDTPSFFVYIPYYIYTFIPAYLPTYILSYPPFHENVYSDLFRISLSIFGFSKDNTYLCRRNNLYIITQQTEKNR